MRHRLLLSCQFKQSLQSKVQAIRLTCATVAWSRENSLVLTKSEHHLTRAPISSMVRMQMNANSLLSQKMMRSEQRRQRVTPRNGGWNRRRTRNRELYNLATLQLSRVRMIHSSVSPIVFRALRNTRQISQRVGDCTGDGVSMIS